MFDGSWWREGVLYQIYPRSFADSDGDGIGDLRGIAERLDHLRVAGGRRPLAQPDDAVAERRLGLRRRRLLRRPSRPRHARGPGRARGGGGGARASACCSTSSPTTRAPRTRGSSAPPSGRDAEFRDFYVWADPGPDGGPPNNWESNFGGSAWQWHEPTGQYYLNNFLPTQPDLNWWNEDVRVAFDDVLRFWFDRGIAGFRIDVCHAIVKDRELRDDPAVRPDDHPEVRAAPSGRSSP